MSKKIAAHQFDHAGRAVANFDHLERELARVEAENARLKRVIVLQEKRWNARPAAASASITRH